MSPLDGCRVRLANDFPIRSRINIATATAKVTHNRSIGRGIRAMSSGLNRRSQVLWVRSIVRSLGWGKAVRYSHNPSQKFSNSNDGKSTEKLVWYEAGEVGDPKTDCFLQLNELAETRGVLICSAAVYAIRYRICTGWHAFRLDQDSHRRSEEAGRLSEWLHYDNFSSVAARREFRLRHPETTGYSWQKIKTDGPPYFVVVTKQRGGIKVSQNSQHSS